MVIILIGVYTNKPGNDESAPPSLPPVNSGVVAPGLPAEADPAPAKGAAAFIGKPAEQFTRQYGEPVRKEPSAYGYEWWVYKNDEFYMLAGVEKKKVVTIFAKGQLDTSPFMIGRPSMEIFSSRYPETEIIVEARGSMYRFELSEEELNLRPLLPVGGFYAQLYIDQQSGELSAVRFMTKDVLLKQRPYELVYEGELPDIPYPGKSLWTHIERGSAAQLADLTLFVRAQEEAKNGLVLSAPLSELARMHSKDMAEAGFFSHDSLQFGDLNARLEEAELAYGTAEELISANYPDAPAAMEAWLNSPEDREVLLGSQHAFFGTGAYRTHFTEIFTGAK